MKFPFYVLQEGQDPLSLDPSNFYYFLAQGGVYQVRRTPFYTSVTQANSPRLLGYPETQPLLRATFPNVPARLLEQAGSFFHWAHHKKRAEAIVLLYLHQGTGEWTAHAPDQYVPVGHDGWTYLHLTYNPSSVQRPPDTLLYGSIHSHCDGAASHSGTDRHDEEWGDGLHITFGHVDKAVPSLVSTFVSNKIRFEFEPSEVLDPFQIRVGTHPAEWETRHHYQASNRHAWKWGME